MRAPIQQLKYCELAFRYAGISSAYYQLNLQSRLETAQNSDYLARELNFNPSALERFLNATSFLELTRKLSDKTYQHVSNVIYSSEPTKILIALVEKKLPDLLFLREKNKIDELFNAERTLLDKSVEMGLIKKNRG